jgi:repressor LexA
MKKLTEKENKILSDIKQNFREYDEMPTYSELAKINGVSKNAIFKTIKRLRTKEYLTANNELIDKEDIKKYPSLPILGSIAAGSPLEAFEVIDQASFEKMLTTPNLFLLKVQGDSMIEAGILDGDLVLIQKQDQIKSGNIVVALVDNSEATLKEIQFNDHKSVTLIPHNHSYEPMKFDRSRVEVQGVYVGARFDTGCFK